MSVFDMGRGLTQYGTVWQPPAARDFAGHQLQTEVYRLLMAPGTPAPSTVQTSASSTSGVYWRARVITKCVCGVQASSADGSLHAHVRNLSQGELEQHHAQLLMSASAAPL